MTRQRSQADAQSDGSSARRLLPFRGVWPEHALAEGGILILPDLADLAAADPVEQAVVVVITQAGLGLHIAARLHHHPFVVGNESKGHGAAALPQRLHVAVEIAEHGFLAVEGL